MALARISKSGSRLAQLQALKEKLATSIDACDDEKALAPLAKQYRETLKEIEEIKDASNDGDEISEILAQRKADGKSGAIRKSRT